MNYRNWSWMCVCVCERRWFALNKCGWGSCIIDRRTYVMKQSGWKLSSAWDNFSSHKDYWETDATDKPFLNRKTKMKMTHLFGGNKRKTKRSDFPSTPLVRSVCWFQLWGRSRFCDTRCASQEGVRADFVEFWSSKEFLFPHALALRRSDKIR